MKIKLYNYTGETKRVNKTNFLTNATELDGTLRVPTDILKPVISIERSLLPTFNYCYIPDFNRYYFIEDIITQSYNVYIISLKIDDLYSHQTAINNQYALIDRCEDVRYINNELIDDLLPLDKEEEIERVDIEPSDYGFTVYEVSNEKHFVLTMYNGSETTNPPVQMYGEKIDFPCPVINHYAVNYTQLNQFRDWLLGNNIGNTGNFFTNPQEYLMGIMYFPFSTPKNMKGKVGVYPTIKIGKTDTHIGCEILTINFKDYIYFKNFTIERKYNNFLDYAPYTEIYLWLPFIKFVKLNTNMLMGKTVSLKYSVDYNTGQCQAYIIDTSTNTTIQIESGQIGINIPFGTTNSNEIRRNATMNLIKGIGVMSIESQFAPVLATRVIGNAISDSVERFNVTGTCGDSNNLSASLTPYLIYVRRKPIEPNNYLHLIGKPSLKTLQLNVLNGFTKINNITLSSFSTATSPEIATIESHLKEGVILGDESLLTSTMVINNVTYTFVNGWTFSQWIASNYNVDNYSISIDGFVVKNSKIVMNNGIRIKDTFMCEHITYQLTNAYSTFNIDGVTYNYFINSIFGEWVNSEFNTSSYKVYGTLIHKDNLFVARSNISLLTDYIHNTTQIQEGVNYTTKYCDMFTINMVAVGYSNQECYYDKDYTPTFNDIVVNGSMYFNPNDDFGILTIRGDNYVTYKGYFLKDIHTNFYIITAYNIEDYTDLEATDVEP